MESGGLKCGHPWNMKLLPSQDIIDTKDLQVTQLGWGHRQGCFYQQGLPGSVRVVQVRLLLLSN